jgi:hypothetical protein
VLAPATGGFSNFATLPEPDEYQERFYGASIVDIERWAATTAASATVLPCRSGPMPAAGGSLRYAPLRGCAVVGAIRPLEADHPLQQEFQRIEGVEGDDRLHRVVVEKTRAAGPPRPDKFRNSDDRPARRPELNPNYMIVLRRELQLI